MNIIIIIFPLVPGHMATRGVDVLTRPVQGRGPCEGPGGRVRAPGAGGALKNRASDTLLCFVAIIITC